MLLLSLLVLAKAYIASVKTLKIVGIPKPKEGKKPEGELIYDHGTTKWPETLVVKDSTYTSVGVYCFLADNSTKKKPKTNPEQFSVLLTLDNPKEFPAGYPQHQQIPFEIPPKDAEIDLPAAAIGEFGAKWDSGLTMPGTYKMSIIASDETMDQPFELKLGTIKLGFTQKPTTDDITVAKRRFYFLEKEKDWFPKKPIEHIFKKPEERPPHVVPLVFLILVWAVPMLVLVFGLFRIGANFAYFPKSGPGMVFNVSFQILLLVIAALLLCFFFFLNLLELSKFITPALIVVILVGHKSLCAVKDVRYLGWIGESEDKKDN